MPRLPFRPFLAVLATMLCAVSPGRATVSLVADINTRPLIASSAPREFVTAGGQVFFVATTPAAGVGLWKTDGTAGGTVLVHAFGGERTQRFWLTALGD